MLLFFILSGIILYNLIIVSKRFKSEPFVNVAEAINTEAINTEVINNKSTTVNADLKKSNPILNMILLGDSILRNNAYVNPKYSIDYLLKIQCKQNNFFLAKDGADIKTVYKQVQKIPDRLNTADSAIFLSVGGNDLLQKNSKVDVVFAQYEKLVRDIKTTFGNCKFVILNLYTPPAITNPVLRNKIQQWNTLLKEYALRNNINIIPLATILYEPTDFVDSYEPSEIGGVKIVKAIRMEL